MVEGEEMCYGVPLSTNNLKTSMRSDALIHSELATTAICKSETWRGKRHEMAAVAFIELQHPRA